MPRCTASQRRRGGASWRRGVVASWPRGAGGGCRVAPGALVRRGIGDCPRAVPVLRGRPGVHIFASSTYRGRARKRRGFITKTDPHNRSAIRRLARLRRRHGLHEPAAGIVRLRSSPDAHRSVSRCPSADAWCVEFIPASTARDPAVVRDGRGLAIAAGRGASHGCRVVDGIPHRCSRLLERGHAGPPGQPQRAYDEGASVASGIASGAASGAA